MLDVIEYARKKVIAAMAVPKTHLNVPCPSIFGIDHDCQPPEPAKYHISSAWWEQICGWHWHVIST